MNEWIRKTIKASAFPTKSYQKISEIKEKVLIRCRWG